MDDPKRHTIHKYNALDNTSFGKRYNKQHEFNEQTREGPKEEMQSHGESKKNGKNNERHANVVHQDIKSCIDECPSKNPSLCVTHDTYFENREYHSIVEIAANEYPLTSHELTLFGKVYCLRQESDDHERRILHLERSLANVHVQMNTLKREKLDLEAKLLSTESRLQNDIDEEVQLLKLGGKALERKLKKKMEFKKSESRKDEQIERDQSLTEIIVSQNLTIMNLENEMKIRAQNVRAFKNDLLEMIEELREEYEIRQSEQNEMIKKIIAIAQS